MKPTDTSDLPHQFFPTIPDVVSFTTSVLIIMASRMEAAGIMTRAELGEACQQAAGGQEEGPARYLLDIFALAMVATDTSPPDLRIVED